MIDYSLKGKTALVTGAAYGLGRAIAIACSQAGARLAIADIASEQLTQLANEIRGNKGEVISVVADLREPNGAEAFVGKAKNAYGSVDVLVNNVGGAFGKHFKSGSILQLTESDLMEAFRLNVITTFLCSRAAAPIMLEQGKGAIVNIASMSGRGPMPGFGGAYGAAKAAVISLTQNMAAEWAPKVRVNALAPSGFENPHLWEYLTEEQKAGMAVGMEASLSRIAMGRLADPAEIAAAVVYLASDAAAWTTGTIIEMHGGRKHY